jgi:hypothetical protein
MIRTALQGLGEVGCGPFNSGLYDSNGFDIYNRCAARAGAGADDLGSPTAKPFWNVFGRLRIPCVNTDDGELEASRRIESVLAALAGQGYEIGPINVGFSIGRNGREGEGIKYPSFCGQWTAVDALIPDFMKGENTAPNELVVRLYHKTKSSSQAKSAVFDALAALGWDMGSAGNWTVETFRQAVTDTPERGLTRGTEAVRGGVDAVAQCLGDPKGDKSSAILKNVSYSLLGMVGIYFLATVVRPLMPSSR